jgi:hypothetical protein
MALKRTYLTSRCWCCPGMETAYRSLTPSSDCRRINVRHFKQLWFEPLLRMSSVSWLRSFSGPCILVRSFWLPATREAEHRIPPELKKLSSVIWETGESKVVIMSEHYIGQLLLAMALRLQEGWRRRAGSTERAMELTFMLQEDFAIIVRYIFRRKISVVGGK